MAPAEIIEDYRISELVNQSVPSKSLTFNVNSPRVSYDDKHEKVLAVFRCLVADLCQQFGGGHPGGAMGMAAIGTALWKYVMRISPSNPSYFNRDRFVLSNGHTSLFQYTFHHLVGYKHMTLDQLKSYHSDRIDSYAPGHPEIEHPGVEVTTGPLGQGVANSVGLAAASKHLAATYNRPGHEIINNMTWCMVGDACLQEGVALEAFQLAGHWKLNNLAVIYDNNQITCDGSVDVVCSEDINAKMRSVGFNVIDVWDGCFDVNGIVKALETARASTDKPTFINCRTVIGIGSQKAGQAKTHGSAFGIEDVAYIKKAFGRNPDEHLIVTEDVYEFFRDIKGKGEALEAEWEEKFAKYEREYPEVAAELKERIAGKVVGDWQNLIPSKHTFPTTKTASRKSAGIICNALAANSPSFMVGTADLTPSVNMSWKGNVAFQNPGLKTTCGLKGDYSGRYIHYGIREHAMAAIANGLAAFNKGTIFPVTSSFFMFYIYAAPAVRMGALQGLQQIHIATHDAIGTGEDGPTHQPIALPALYRAMPNFLYIRPCDTEETAGAFISAINATETPSLISLSRQGLTQFPEYSSRDGVQKGAYVFIEEEGADVTLIGVGSEMNFAVEAREKLAEQGIKARIVSFPCQRLFELQSKQYKESVMQYKKRIPTIVIEAYSPLGWERYADAAYSMGSFGKSLPGDDAYEFFGYEAGVIAEKVKAFVDEVKVEGIESVRGDFRDLNGKLGIGMIDHFHKH